MTAIEGFGATLTQASFGVSVEACIPGNNWNGMALGDPATPTLRIAGLSWPSSRCGPERWLGSYATTAWVPGDDPSELAVTITIEGFAGDWDNEIPEEPARIFGHLSGDLVGPFEAIRCDLLDQEITNCS